ncbi:hypothetical protein CONPUDRAFT_77302 [Coniophora puteana RWD-64-598 SS2]|uniref:F-box domain-containing protein n=1 Tax=Coniophora puteana (strain RWD-64-598) TaxID=741705 RepID=A0A5M3M8Y4_CONPW|nr:uncharacterized protein CONPUDRAFT_77302 [Coniophora puteana RWD-64-598 SS2]EIW75668.1 hypothetical protein CONPUDRAFT_77302 [Coniophora puteana RWD-64-598 SS2]
MAIKTLDTLPLDVLVHIAGLLDPLDVLALRQNLEDTIVRSAMVERQLVDRMSPRKVRRIALDIDEQGKACLLAGRWLVSKSYNKVLCRDLDSAHGSESKVIYEVFRPGFLSYVTSAEIVDYEGRYHGYVVLSERQLGRNWGDRVTILKAKSTLQNIELMKISCFSLPDTSFIATEVKLTIGPNVLLIWWQQHFNSDNLSIGHLRKYALIDFTHVEQTPIIQTTMDQAEPSLEPFGISEYESTHFVVSSTHLIVMTVAVVLPVLVHDSTSTINGETSITLAGFTYGIDIPKSYLVTLSLPTLPAEEARSTPSACFDMRVGTITELNSWLSMSAHPILKGPVRVLFSLRDATHGRRHLCLRAVSFGRDADEPIRGFWAKSPTMRIGGLDAPDVVRGINDVEDVDLLRGRVCLYEEVEYEEGEVTRERIILDFA